MGDDRKTDAVATDAQGKDAVEGADVTRRSFSFLAAAVPAFVALSCKQRQDGAALLANDGTTAQAQSNTFRNMTSAALGEEGSRGNGRRVTRPRAGTFTTQALGEEGGATTRALTEEGGGMNPPMTTQALGEEGDGARQMPDESWDNMMTTQALGEEGGGDGGRIGREPTVTTRGLDEEAGEDGRVQHMMTSAALGEEAGRGGTFDQIRAPRAATTEENGFRTFQAVQSTAGLAGDNDYAKLKATADQAESGDDFPVMTSAALGEEGSGPESEVMLTSLALGEEANDDQNDDLYLTTRSLNEEGTGGSFRGVEPPVNATTLAVGEEAGDRTWTTPDFDYAKGRLPVQQRAIATVHRIFASLGQPAQVTFMDIDTQVTPRTNRQVLNIMVEYVMLPQRAATNAKPQTGSVRVRWVQGWNEAMFGNFADIQIRRNLGIPRRLPG